MNRADVRKQIATTLNRSERKKLQLVRRNKVLRPSQRAKDAIAVMEPALKRTEPERAKAREQAEGIERISAAVRRVEENARRWKNGGAP